MKTHAVIEVGGKQYLVQKNDELIVENLNRAAEETVEFPALLSFDSEKTDSEIGSPELKEKVTAKVIENIKGDKVRVAKFKAKVRYRKVRGFRPQLTKIKITAI